MQCSLISDHFAMKFCEVSKGFAVFSVEFYRKELREGVSRLVNLHHELVIELATECTLKTINYGVQ